jgi:hypothetical protein
MAQAALQFDELATTEKAKNIRRVFINYVHHAMILCRVETDLSECGYMLLENIRKQIRAEGFFLFLAIFPVKEDGMNLKSRSERNSNQRVQLTMVITNETIGAEASISSAF